MTAHRRAHGVDPAPCKARTKMDQGTAGSLRLLHHETESPLYQLDRRWSSPLRPPGSVAPVAAPSPEHDQPIISAIVIERSGTEGQRMPSTGGGAGQRSAWRITQEQRMRPAAEPSG